MRYASRFALLGMLSAISIAHADWTRFRGENGFGVAAAGKSTPIEWNEKKNLKWKVPLPGPGLSSPIIVGDRIFVTAWSGYGVDRQNLGDQRDLRRHLLCLDRTTGATVWSKEFEPVLPEDNYRGMFAENGYASHTPVSDGERVYAFFGKSGVHAFDMDGNPLWHASVGTGSDPNGWGSAASPVLHENLLIVTASAESQSLVAFDKISGEEVWRQQADGLVGTWGTPILVETDGQTDLVLAVPYEIWGINPENGKLRWYCEAVDTNSVCSSVIADDGIIYAVGGRNGGSIAVKAGGTDDVTQTNVLWSGRDRARIGSPVLNEGRLYWIAGGIANCVEAKTGDRIYQSRLSGTAEVAGADRGRRGQRGARQGGRRRGGGGPGGQDYSSPIIADGKLYFVTRSGEAYVIALGPEFKTLAKNSFGDDPGEFSATPAVVDGELYFRSTKYLFCIAEQ